METQHNYVQESVSIPNDGNFNQNKKDMSLINPIKDAVKNNNREEIIQLVKAGAPLNHYEKQNPLYLAAKNNDMELIELLIKYGADVNYAVVDGQTPLHIAVIHQHFDVIQYLIQHNADVNAETVDYWTPLHSACSLGNLKIIEYLIEHGGDIRMVSASFMDCLLICLRNKHLDAASLIMQHSPNPRDVWICHELIKMAPLGIRIVLDNFFDPYSMPEYAKNSVREDNKFFIENWFV